MTRKEAMLSSSAIESLMDCKARIEAEFKMLFGLEFPKTDYLASSVDDKLKKKMELITDNFEEIARLVGDIKAFSFQHSRESL